MLNELVFQKSERQNIFINRKVFSVLDGLSSAFRGTGEASSVNMENKLFQTKSFSKIRNDKTFLSDADVFRFGLVHGLGQRAKRVR